MHCPRWGAAWWRMCGSLQWNDCAGSVGFMAALHNSGPEGALQISMLLKMCTNAVALMSEFATPLRHQ